ncbi:hypothetical protein [Ginsengibacter hankyongi]|nr:hypothetical protein [Ginsengibacter hankyongi]
MQQTYSKLPYNCVMPIPAAYLWPALTNKSSDELELDCNNPYSATGRGIK